MSWRCTLALAVVAGGATEPHERIRVPQSLTTASEPHDSGGATEPHDRIRAPQWKKWTRPSVSSIPVQPEDSEEVSHAQGHVFVGASQDPDAADGVAVNDGMRVSEETRWLYKNWPGLLFLGALCFYAFERVIRDQTKDRKKERNVFNTLGSEDAGVNPSGGGRQSYADIMNYISLDKDGGLDKVSQLIGNGPSSARLAAFCLLFAGILFNVGVIVHMDIDIMDGAMHDYRVNYRMEGHLEGSAASAQLDGYERSRAGEIQEFLSRSSGEGVAIIGLNIFVLTAMAELASLIVIATMFAQALITFFIRKDNETEKFDAYAALFEAAETAEWLATFSALKLISVVHPALIGRRFAEYMSTEPLGSGRVARVIQVLFFVVTRVGGFVLGLLAFAVKLAIVSVYLYVPILRAEHSSSFLLAWHVLCNWCQVLGLLFQALNAVNMNQVLRWRVLLLVIGGEDSIVDEDEATLLNVYLARVAQAIHDQCYEKGRYLSFWVLLFTFKDTDFQFLLINEDQTQKAKWRRNFAKQLTHTLEA